MIKLLIPIMLLLSGCLVPPSASSLSQTDSEASKKWTKWQTKWSTYKLGNYPEIKDMMHAVGYSYNANRLPYFSISYDRIYDLSGHNDLHPSGKLRWIDWESFRQDGRPWRDPIFIDELNEKHNVELKYRSTQARHKNYIHHFTGGNDNYYFRDDKLIAHGKIQLLPWGYNSQMIYREDTGALVSGNSVYVSGIKEAKLSLFNHGASLHNGKQAFYISESSNTITPVSTDHQILGELGGNLYTLVNKRVYKSQLVRFIPRLWKELTANERIYALNDSLVVVDTVSLKFNSFNSKGKVSSNRYPFTGRYRFNQVAQSSNSLLFSFENATTSKQLIEFNATKGNFTTVRFAAPAFFANRFSKLELANDFELFQSKSTKRDKLIVQLYSPNSFPLYRYLGDIGRCWLEDLGNYARVEIASPEELNAVLDKVSKETKISLSKIGIMASGDLASNVLEQISNGAVSVGALLLYQPTRAISIPDAVALPPIYIISERYGAINPFPARMLVRELHQINADYYFVEKVAKRKFWSDYYQEFKAVRASEFAFFGLHL